MKELKFDANLGFQQKAKLTIIAEEIVKLCNEYVPIFPMQAVFRDNGFEKKFVQTI